MFILHLLFQWLKMHSIITIRWSGHLVYWSQVRTWKSIWHSHCNSWFMFIYLDCISLRSFFFFSDYFSFCLFLCSNSWTPNAKTFLGHGINHSYYWCSFISMRMAGLQTNAGYFKWWATVGSMCIKPFFQTLVLVLHWDGKECKFFLQV